MQKKPRVVKSVKNSNNNVGKKIQKKKERLSEGALCSNTWYEHSMIHLGITYGTISIGFQDRKGRKKSTTLQTFLLALPLSHQFISLRLQVHYSWPKPSVSSMAKVIFSTSCS